MKTYSEEKLVKLQDYILFLIDEAGQNQKAAFETLKESSVLENPGLFWPFVDTDLSKLKKEIRFEFRQFINFKNEK